MTNTKHQLGVEAARSGQRRDERMSAEWLAGFDAEAADWGRDGPETILNLYINPGEVPRKEADRKNDISAGEKVFRGAERAAVVAWLRKETSQARSEIVEYRGRGDTVGALCTGERILTLRQMADAIERGEHMEGDA